MWLLTALAFGNRLQLQASGNKIGVPCCHESHAVRLADDVTAQVPTLSWDIVQSWDHNLGRHASSWKRESMCEKRKEACLLIAISTQPRFQPTFQLGPFFRPPPLLPQPTSVVRRITPHHGRHPGHAVPHAHMPSPRTVIGSLASRGGAHRHNAQLWAAIQTPRWSGVVKTDGIETKPSWSAPHSSRIARGRKRGPQATGVTKDLRNQKTQSLQ